RADGGADRVASRDGSPDHRGGGLRIGVGHLMHTGIRAREHLTRSPIRKAMVSLDPARVESAPGPGRTCGATPQGTCEFRGRRAARGGGYWVGQAAPALIQATTCAADVSVGLFQPVIMLPPVCIE